MPIVIAPNAIASDTFQRLQAHDPNLSSVNFSNTMAYCDEVFVSPKPIRDLLAPGIVDLSGVEWGFPLVNGIRSLSRRGYYKIIESPFERDITNLQGQTIRTWSAMVLFYPAEGGTHYLKFLANIGPLVNANAMGYNMTTYGSKFISGSTLNVTKAAFFQHMFGKVFYVSQQMYVNAIYRQTVWFKFQ